MRFFQQSVGVSVIFNDGANVAFSFPIHAYSRLIVDNPIEKGGGKFDAGEIRVSPSDGEKFDISIDLLAADLSRDDLCRSDFCRVLSTKPDWISATVRPVEGPPHESVYSADELSVFTRKFILNLTGTNKQLNTLVETSFGFFDGQSSVISFRLASDAQIVAAPDYLVFRPGEVRKLLSVTRRDNASFDLPTIAIDDPSFVASSLTPRNAIVHQIEVRFATPSNEVGPKFRRANLALTFSEGSEPELTVPLVFLAGN